MAVYQNSQNRFAPIKKTATRTENRKPLKCQLRGWSGDEKVLGKLPVPGHPTILLIVGQGPTALAVGSGGGCLDIFTLIYLFSSLSFLWETARID